MKRVLAFLLAAVMSVTAIPPQAAWANADITIFNHPVQAEFTGITEGRSQIANLSFDDVDPSHWASESIARAGAFDVLWGYESSFNPYAEVTNEQAIAFVLRVIGREWEALERAAELQEDAPLGSPMRNIWSIGYLDIAQDMGLISNDDYLDALVDMPEMLDPDVNFIRDLPVSRENAVYWLVRAIEIGGGDVAGRPAAWDTSEAFQRSFTFPDWEDVSIDRVRTMERALQTGMILGIDGQLDPHGPLRRIDMARAVSYMDDVFFASHSLTRRSGTVGGIRESEQPGSTTGQFSRYFYVRTDTGIERLIYREVRDPGTHPRIYDAVTYRNNTVGSMTSLQEGDLIEFFTRTDGGGQVIYINVLNSETGTVPMAVQGRLTAVDIEGNTITIVEGAAGVSVTYNMMQSLTGVNHEDYDDEDDLQFLQIDGRWIPYNNIPFGAIVELTLRNNVVQLVSFVGQPALVLEERGIVIENNPILGYITYFNNYGQEVTRYYIDGEMTVRKQPFYLNDDEIGYLSDMFTNFRYNPMDAHISEIEAGDIVFMRFDPGSPDTIISISASPNHISRHARILNITRNDNSPRVYTLIVEYDNLETATFDVPSTITPWLNGAPIRWADVHVGDHARILVNRAILEPGHVLESIKDIIIEGGAHFIPTIIRGRLSSVNRAQNLLQINNAQTLTENGWRDNRTVGQFNIARREIEYFLDGERIPLDHAIQHLRRGAEVYIALENHFAGERVRKVTFRTGRDELLPAETVMSSNAQGFTILGNEGEIATDAGTIVRRNNRLVSANDIHPNDFARVSLNGGSRAAIVDIFPRPSVAGAQIITGRIMSIDSTNSFTVETMSTIVGNEWSFTPIQRIFTIDPDTIIRYEGGFIPHDQFTMYSTDGGWDSFFDRVVHIVVDGARAELVVLPGEGQGRFANQAVRGTILVADTGGETSNFRLHNVEVLDHQNGIWEVVSNIMPEANVGANLATIVIRNNQVIRMTDLRPGERVRVMTSVTQMPQRPFTPPIEVFGLIIFVEG